MSRIVNSRIVCNELLNHNVSLVELELGEPVERLAGQYCELIIDGKSYAYSIASAPEAIDIVELHIRSEKNNENSLIVADYLKNNQLIDVKLPMGECVITDVPKKHLLLIAGSTGFSGLKSILLFLAAQKLEQTVWFYWGGRKESDLYDHEELSNFIANYSREGFRYTPVVSDEDETSCRKGFVHEAVLEDAKQGFFDLKACDIVIAGSPAMVYGVCDALVAAGADRKAIQSDVFAYAPRD